MKRDLDRFAQNLSRYDSRKQNGLRSLAAEKAEIGQLCELFRQSTHAISYTPH